MPPSPLQLLPEHPGADAGIRLYVKRDELLHPVVQGNKWRKLAPVLPVVEADFPGGIVTFGGPFSNHLQAVAAAGRAFGIATTGIVRGQHADPGNPTLSAARADGMTLRLIAKKDYDALKNDPETLRRDYPGACILPEGGATRQAAENCAAISREIIEQLTLPDEAPLFICTPAGTGCTAAGVVQGFGERAGQVLVFPVVNHGFDAAQILRFLPENASEFVPRFRIIPDYEFGGFAKQHPVLLDFVERFHQTTGILPDPVYTAKMFFGVFDLLSRGFFPPESTVVMLHTGGLQGWAGFLSYER